ncbi:MAG: hypothetical protein FIA97_14445 [Methylococcaceae bacterium]|nr:hypothetical protein [Methylococcaceae bacterium]
MPALPFRLSLPSPPARVSLPSPPLRVSLPEPAAMESAPAWALKVSPTASCNSAEVPPVNPVRVPLAALATSSPVVPVKLAMGWSRYFRWVWVRCRYRRISAGIAAHVRHSGAFHKANYGCGARKAEFTDVCKFGIEFSRPLNGKATAVLEPVPLAGVNSPEAGIGRTQSGAKISNSGVGSIVQNADFSNRARASAWLCPKSCVLGAGSCQLKAVA